MTDLWLAEASDIAVWVSMGVLALAMLAFAAHLAVTGSVATRRGESQSGVEQSREASARSVGGGQADGGVGTLVRAAPEDGGRSGAPTRRWGVAGLQLTLVSTVALIAGLLMRGLSVSRLPLGNMYEFALVACAFALVIYSVWALRRERLWLGLFVTVPVLVIMGVAMVSWYAEASQLMPSLNSIWLGIHVTVATLSVAVLLIGAVVAGLYLLKDRAERSAGAAGVQGWLSTLPRAAVLERTTYGLHIVGFPMWTFTVMAGAVWAEHAWGRYWGWDSKEIWSFVIWTVYAAYLHARATTGWSVRRATWLAIAGFVCIILNYTVVNIFFVGWHSYSGV